MQFSMNTNSETLFRLLWQKYSNIFIFTAIECLIFYYYSACPPLRIPCGECPPHGCPAGYACCPTSCGEICYKF